jgi:FtsP/CotA-like multicopper oxidase with cupredoxin domain
MTVSRRNFLKTAGLGVVGATLVRALPGVDAVAAAQGPVFPTPVEIGERLADGSVHIALEAVEREVPVAGRFARLWTYNGSFPGPTLRLREGERVELELTNRLAEPTNFHFHGLHISPTGRGDNVFRHVSPGETARYAFTVPQGSAGTYWYHPHVHKAVSKQLFQGLAGAIVVEGAADAALLGLPEQLLVLKDLEFQANGRIPEHTKMDWMMGREGSLLAVNGAEQPRLQVPGGAVRLRLLNASNARYYRLHIPDATLKVTATDGGSVGTPYAVDELLLAPGERYEVVARFPGRGRYTLQTLPYNRAPEEVARRMGDGGGMAGMAGMAGMNPAPNDGGAALLQFDVDRAGRFEVPWALTTVPVLQAADATLRRRIVLSEDMEQLKFYIDGKLFDPERTDFAPKLNTLEHWEFVNESGMDHPMHLHVHPFQVYARGGIREPQAAWKDVVNVPAKGSVELLVPFTDFPGKTVMHCHIVEHEDFGMMSVVEVA